MRRDMDAIKIFLLLICLSPVLGQAVGVRFMTLFALEEMDRLDNKRPHDYATLPRHMDVIKNSRGKRFGDYGARFISTKFYIIPEFHPPASRDAGYAFLNLSPLDKERYTVTRSVGLDSRHRGVFNGGTYTVYRYRESGSRRDNDLQGQTGTLTPEKP